MGNFHNNRTPLRQAHANATAMSADRRPYWGCHNRQENNDCSHLNLSLRADAHRCAKNWSLHLFARTNTHKHTHIPVALFPSHPSCSDFNRLLIKWNIVLHFVFHRNSFRLRFVHCSLWKHFLIFICIQLIQMLLFHNQWKDWRKWGF